LYRRLCARMRNRSALAAGVMLLAITFLLVIPLFLIAIALVHQANNLIAAMQSGEARQFLPELALTTRLASLRPWVPRLGPATFRGYVVTGIVAGVVTAIGLVITDVPSALFWGAFATVLSLLPFVGPPVVWVPAAAYLYFQVSLGHASMWQPVVLTLWGVVLVPIVEHVVRPWAM